MKLCLLLKNKFYIDKNTLISNGSLWNKENGILGFKIEEFKRLIFVGLRVNENLPEIYKEIFKNNIEKAKKRQRKNLQRFSEKRFLLFVKK
jgi:hypothetical protein